MLRLVYGMNSPLISASLVRHSLLHFHLSHMAVHHLHHLHYHRLHLLSLAQYFILNSRRGSSANHSLHRPFCFPTGLITRILGTSNDITLLNGLIGQCVRQSRLLVGFECTLNHCYFIHFIHSFHTCLNPQVTSFIVVVLLGDLQISWSLTVNSITNGFLGWK